MRYHALLPEAMCPEQTEGYEGFLHLRKIAGTEEDATLDYLIRDHDAARFEEKKELMRNAADTLNASEGEGTASVDIADSYRNMKEVIARVPHVLERAVRAVKARGMEPAFVPIRGGTDGARLSFSGLPCPNLGTGGMNWHSLYEFIPVESLEKMAEVLVQIVRA
jgi:tripeptide aminopeptidase